MEKSFLLLASRFDLLLFCLTFYCNFVFMNRPEEDLNYSMCQRRMKEIIFVCQQHIKMLKVDLKFLHLEFLTVHKN